jgi:hypothetical protein
MATEYEVSRNEAIKRLGLKAVEAVEKENCEPTNRVQDDNDTTIEYAASVVRMIDGHQVVLTAYYYPDESEFYGADGEPIEDLGNIDWKIARYEIV